LSVQDRPTALELLAAVRSFLEDDLVPGLEGRRRFHALVAANVLGIVEREVAGEEAQLASHWDRLASLFALDPTARPQGLGALRAAVRDLETRLADDIRAGLGDDPARRRAVRDHVRATVREKLAVANPRFVGG
jgi:hypothetical protein